ncbi:hypothetical protein [Methylomonas methanica]|uniref:hypothetical protein n=1 Tax=Methylomonas methanica TaxID=421 RepID=UPI0002FFB139|nr:hypothetical protein [Methylomonas methanica]
MSLTEPGERWRGDLILFTSEASLAAELSKFYFTWFVPALVKYRKLLLKVLLVSFVLQLFARVTPLRFQIVMDKVLVDRGFTALDIITASLWVQTGSRICVFADGTFEQPQRVRLSGKIR